MFSYAVHPMVFVSLYFILVYCWAPFYLTLIPAWISNYTHYKLWDEITYPFLNFNGCTIEVQQWISNLISHFIMDVITYPCWD